MFCMYVQMYMQCLCLYIYTKFICQDPCLCLCKCTCPCDMLCAMSIRHMHDIERMILHDMIDMHVVNMHVSICALSVLDELPS